MLNFELGVVQQIAILALQLGVIIFAAKFCGDLAKKFKLPSVLGELSAGIIIGPYVLGKIPLPFHGLEHGLFAFTKEVVIQATQAYPVVDGVAAIQNVTFQTYYPALYAIATLGSILLLFISGLETDLRMFFKYSVVGTVVGIGGVIFSFLFGAAVGVYMLHYPGFMDPRSLFLGILCTATSVGITARILSEKKKVDSPEGVTILAAAVIDDVLGIICLAIVLGIVGAMSGGGAIQWGSIGLIAAKCIGIWLGATAIGLILARYVAKFLRIFKSPVVFATLAFGIALIISGLFEQSGLAMIIGAYVVGLSLSKTDVSFAVQHTLEPLYNFLVPVFFVVMGMLVDVRVFTNPTVLKVGLIYSVLAILAKIIGCALPSLFMNFNVLGALRIGTGMVPRGEVALIIAGIGAGMTMKVNGQMIPILDSELFGVAIIMTLLTTVAAPPLLSIMLGIGGKGVRKETKDKSVVNTVFDFPSFAITEFVLKRMAESLEQEGYMMSPLDKETGVMQIRKDNMSFRLTVSDNTFTFESDADEVTFINAIMYETFVELHQTMSKFKQLANPREMKRSFLETPASNASEAGGKASDSAVAQAKKSLLEKALSPSCVVMNLKADTKEGVIRELIDCLDANGKIRNPKMCLDDVLEREKVVTTCVQAGIALPHGRTDGVDTIAAAVGIHKEGYDFDSLDGKPTKLFVLFLSSRSSNGPHVEFISSVASVLSRKENVDRIIAASTPDEVLSVLFQKKVS